MLRRECTGVMKYSGYVLAANFSCFYVMIFRAKTCTTMEECLNKVAAVSVIVAVEDSKKFNSVAIGGREKEAENSFLPPSTFKGTLIKG